MSFVQLGLPPRPGVIDVEKRAHGVEDNGLTAIVVLQEEESTVVGPDVPIHAARHKGFTRRLPNCFLKMDCARKIHTELALCSLWTDESRAAGRVLYEIKSTRCGGSGSRCGVI